MEFSDGYTIMTEIQSSKACDPLSSSQVTNVNRLRAKTDKCWSYKKTSLPFAPGVGKG